MKVWKLISGILSIILCVLVAFQSCAAGLSNALEESGELSGSAGLIVSVLMLTGGIVSIATRKSTGKGAGIALIIIFGIVSLIGFSAHGSFSDLVVWSVWCVINAALALVSVFTSKKAKVD